MAYATYISEVLLSHPSIAWMGGWDVCATLTLKACLVASSLVYMDQFHDGEVLVTATIT